MTGRYMTWFACLCMVIGALLACLRPAAEREVENYEARLLGPCVKCDTSRPVQRQLYPRGAKVDHRVRPLHGQRGAGASEGVSGAAQSSRTIPLSQELQDTLHTACEEYGVPYTLALAVMETESGFDPTAVGPDGHDIGLYQIRTSNHAWLTEETGADPLTPEGNIKCGVWLIGYLLGRYDSTEAALTAYRYGHDNGTRGYAKEVMERVSKWESVLGQ